MWGREVEIDVATMLCPSLKWSPDRRIRSWPLGINMVNVHAVMNNSCCWDDLNGGIFDMVERVCKVNGFIFDP